MKPCPSSAEEMLARLVERGSAIVSSGSCSEMEIADAHARGDFYVDHDGYGYVLRLRAWLDKVHARDGYMQEGRGVPDGSGPGHVADSSSTVA